ncbi:OsmC family protein [Candidatus Bipolaricaulota bacterium]|nr:OsmC family protein [Candidatus Bipolaricaulota bacterium]TFH11307.1 MAG: OsmC family peroxiredoxin [Candidatus Atribacteria bacterium]
MGKTIVEYRGGMAFVGKVRSGHDVFMDAGESSGGADSAPRPVEILLSSLGGCTGMDVIAVLRKKQTLPESLAIEIDDERAPDYPKVITKIHLTYKVSGNVPEENLVKAIELSLAKYCPIANTLAGVAQISYEYAITPS